MPWCGGCEHYFAPAAVRADGSCPRCGDRVDPGGLAALGGAEPAVAVPWHFKVFVAAFALYLGYRAWQLVGLVWK